MNQKIKYRDYINIYITSYVALILIIMLGYVLSSCIIDKLDLEYILNNYIYSIKCFTAENSERITYISLVVLFPILYVVLYKIFQRLDIKIKKYKLALNIFSIITIILIILLILLINMLDKENMILKTASKFIIFSLLMSAITIKYKDRINNSKILNYIIYFLTGVSIIFVSYLYINSNFEQCDFVAHHVDAYYYPIQKICNGLTPYVDFTPIYGCYSYAFALIQNIFHNDSLLFFSIINAVLVAMTLTNLSITIYMVIKNRIIGFITFIAILYPMVIYTFVKNSGPYLQYMPHRVLFLSIFLLFVVNYLKQKNSKKYLQFIGFIISAFALFWNLETGLIILIAWNAVLVFQILFYNSFKSKKVYIDILKIIIYDIVTVITLFITIMIITYIRTSKILSLNNVISSQLLFYGSGFNMIKMPLYSPWIILIVTYIIGLIVSLTRIYLINKSKNILFIKYANIFTLSIIGIGIFSYYQGRSHDDVLITVMYPCIILLGIFLDIIFKRVKFLKEKTAKSINICTFIIISGILISLSISTIHSLITDNKIHLYMNKKELSESTLLYDFSDYDVSNMDFILNYESLYYKKYSLKDTKRFSSFVDVFTYNDCERIVDYLKQTDKNVVIPEKIYDFLNGKYNDDFTNNIEAKYNKEEYNRGILILNQK